ncbi:hypothetical protein SNE40_018728 [Patella caerulea]|uniref:Hexosyltransferase n=1 Tax=Patella caerulea TaxID=87958 RepID=A0AAN8PH18_PATCE
MPNINISLTKPHEPADIPMETIPVRLKPEIMADNPVRTSPVGSTPGIISDNSTGPNPIFNGQYILNNISMCTQSEPVNIIVVVHSAPAHFVPRLFIRRTYGARKLFLPTEVRVIFLLGRVEYQNLQREIIDEHNKYGDIIQGDFKDAYHNLTYKAVMGLHWVSHYCPDVKYVIKTDDDAVFDMWRFLKYVYAKKLFMSKTIYGIARLQDLIPRIGKWAVPLKYLRNYTRYPFQYCIGFVLILSSDIIPDLYRASFKVPFFWLDDVYVTGLLRTYVGGIGIRQNGGNLILDSMSDQRECLRNIDLNCPYLAVVARTDTFMVLWNLFKTRSVL